MEAAKPVQPGQFSLKRLFGWVAVCALAAGFFAPYPTQLSPAIKLQVVDDEGYGVPEVFITWSGGFNVRESSPVHVSTDEYGCAELPAQSGRASPARRALAILRSRMPHSGYRRPGSSLQLSLPLGYKFDPGNMVGIARHHESRQDWISQDGVWAIHCDDSAGAREAISLSTIKAEASDTTRIRIAIRSLPDTIFGRYPRKLPPNLSN